MTESTNRPLILVGPSGSGKTTLVSNYLAQKNLAHCWIQIDEEDHIIIGEGRKTILENIEKTGSINQTAKIMKMSYHLAPEEIFEDREAAEQWGRRSWESSSDRARNDVMKSSTSGPTAC